MQSLLSQSESNAFQSFLSSMDYPEDSIPPDEWAAFTASSASMELAYPDVERRQALAKATKDLMSLHTDTTSWDDPGDTSMIHHTPALFDQSRQIQQQDHRYQPESHGVNPYPSRHDAFPFLHLKSHPQQQPVEFPIQHLPVSPYRSGGRGEAISVGTRPKRSHTLPSSSVLPPSSSSSDDSPHKRQRLSSNECLPTSAPAISSAGFSTPAPSKPNLLSVSQKKANHIQSEQKRRANIRRGYAALCETIPALREAIREEEEAERIAAASSNNTVINRVGVDADARRTNGVGKKRRSKKAAGASDLDKIDGRAGPRSENMVLSKSIVLFSLFFVVVGLIF